MLIHLFFIVTLVTKFPYKCLKINIKRKMALEKNALIVSVFNTAFINVVNKSNTILLFMHYKKFTLLVFVAKNN